MSLSKELQDLIAAQGRIFASSIIVAIREQLNEHLSWADVNTARPAKKLAAPKQKKIKKVIVSASVASSTDSGKKPLTQAQLDARRKTLKKARKKLAEIRKANAAAKPKVKKAKRKKAAKVTVEIRKAIPAAASTNGHMKTDSPPSA